MSLIYIIIGIFYPLLAMVEAGKLGDLELVCTHVNKTMTAGVGRRGEFSSHNFSLSPL